MPIDLMTERRLELDTETLVTVYKTMYCSRRLDDKELLLKRQNKVYFQISGAGHEAVLVAAAMVLKPGYDWFYAYYRDRALALYLGLTPYEQLLGAVAAHEDQISGARQMPSHWSSTRLNLVSRSSCTGTQFLEAIGAAEAGHRYSLIKEIEDRAAFFREDEIVYVSAGDGTTSEGEFWESLNTACNLKLPVLYLIEDNGYAISVPVEVQTAGGSISELVRGFPDLLIEKCDGTDFLESLEAMKRAAEHCRSRRGPALVHAQVIRPYSHSQSDDETAYRPEEERAVDAARDPIRKFEAFLLSEKIVTGDELRRIREEVDAEINEATDRALAFPQPPKDSAMLYVYSPDVDPTSSEFDTEDGAELSGNHVTMVDLINRCLHDEMERNPRIVVLGEDVADASRVEYLNRVKGKGGVFKVTSNLQRKFGSDRVYNTPLAEANIIGRAMGMATRGLKPVAEIQFFDYIWPAYMQLHNEVPLLRWRSNNHWKCPMVVRVPVGGYLKGGAIYHSQSGVSLFTAIPGWRVVMPSSALDANGLLRTAIRCDDPVLFLEHKHLYRQTYNKSQYPGQDFMIPFGKAKVVREGSDLTIVTYGALVQRSLVAARQAADEDIDVEVIDLRSLNPYDWNAIEKSIRKTSRVVVAYEDSISWGYGAEIAARIADELFEYLDAPVRRVAALDCFVSYAPDVEDATLPQTEDVLRAIRDLVAY
ncbi:MAG: dehydrogenase E1 component subunit alpha/beta [Acidobacteriota bacterium]|nr:MAG: dehydrogenase E1 component subunit alpha/beta [Acidobacteriota bacterium]